jgi:hypothetical protein
MIYTYTLTIQPYYEYLHQCYRNILVLNNEPIGPLKSITKKMNPPKLSEFNYLSHNNECCYKQKCIYAICDIDNPYELMCLDNIPNLFSYLINNNYIIDTSITKMMQISSVKLTDPIICLISYKID